MTSSDISPGARKRLAAEYDLLATRLESGQLSDEERPAALARLAALRGYPDPALRARIAELEGSAKAARARLEEQQAILAERTAQVADIRARVTTLRQRVDAAKRRPPVARARPAKRSSRGRGRPRVYVRVPGIRFVGASVPCSLLVLVLLAPVALLIALV